MLGIIRCCGNIEVMFEVGDYIQWLYNKKPVGIVLELCSNGYMIKWSDKDKPSICRIIGMEKVYAVKLSREEILEYKLCGQSK